MIGLLVSVFLASLLGSLHCMGMCGGFVSFYAGGGSSGQRRFWGSHFTYSLGRLLTYMMLGALCGGLGGALERGGVVFGLGVSVSYWVGGLMVLWGLVLFLRLGGWDFWHVALPVSWSRRLRVLFEKAQERPPLGRAFLIGLLSTLLPCGWLYAFAATSAATASPWLGMGVMGAFWLGTLPYMLSLGFGLQFLGGGLRRQMPWMNAVLVLFLGVFTLTQRVGLASLSTVVKRQLAGSDVQRGKVLVPAGPACVGVAPEARVEAVRRRGALMSRKGVRRRVVEGREGGKLEKPGVVPAVRKGLEKGE